MSKTMNWNLDADRDELVGGVQKIQKRANKGGRDRVELMQYKGKHTGRTKGSRGGAAKSMGY